jgi:hypothetical protein
MDWDHVQFLPGDAEEMGVFDFRTEGATLNNPTA